MNIENMTPKQAVQEAIRIWLMVAATGQSKAQCCAQLNLHYRCDCPCCHYMVNVKQITGLACSNKDGYSAKMQREYCPLKQLWPNGCEHTDSPYAEYSVAYSKNNIEGMKIAAWKIVEGGYKVLTQMEQDEKLQQELKSPPTVVDAQQLLRENNAQAETIKKFRAELEMLQEKMKKSKELITEVHRKVLATEVLSQEMRNKCVEAWEALA